MGIEINDREYAQIQAFIFDAVGIALGPSKQAPGDRPAGEAPAPPPLRQLQRLPTVAE